LYVACSSSVKGKAFTLSFTIPTEMDCKVLESIKSFQNYVTTLRAVTLDDISAKAMKPCRIEICSALYGTGNADVSGIGVSRVDTNKVESSC